jgi:hypothetical protein
VQRLVERYGFLKSPKTYEEYNDHENGVMFADGTFDGFEVSEVRIFANGLLLTTGGSTDVAERLFADIVTVWQAVGLDLVVEMATGPNYISQLVVKSSIDLLLLNAAIDDVIENWFPKQRVTGELRGPAGIGSVGLFTRGNLEISPIRIERLSGAPVETMEFWSQAPLPTTLHMSFLTRWETVLRETVGRVSLSSPSEPEQPSSQSPPVASK